MRKLPNWLTSYLDFTEHQESPEIFHLWSAISTLASVVGRQVYFDRKFYKIYTNHYIVLVAKSAQCRKSVAVGIARSLLEQAGCVNISADRITNAGLWSFMGRLTEKTTRSVFLIWCDELGLFLSKEETHKGVITTLTRIYTCPNMVVNETKVSGVDYATNVCPNILAATTPSDLAEILPFGATAKGFTPRVHLVYAEAPRPRVADISKDVCLEAELVNDLQHISTLEGEFTWNDEAHSWWKNWYEKEFKAPEVEALDGFYGRKHDFVIKLGMLVSLSQKDCLVLEKQDLTTALTLIDQMEAFMPSAYKHIEVAPTTAHFDRICEQIKRKGGSATKSQLLHDNWNKFDAKELEAVMYSLESAMKVDIKMEGRTTTYKLRK
jgi:hypothetical protein